MSTTYTEAQYATESARAMIRCWYAQHGNDAESVARYMRDTLRIGGIKACRKLVSEAIAEASDAR